jgi:hypothetical protein
MWTPGGGLASADLQCQNEAKAAGLAGTFLALLATDSASAASRLDTTGAPWVRVDGVPVVASALDLVKQNLLAPINLNALGAPVTVNDATWCGASDPITQSAGVSCLSWTSAASTVKGSQLWLDATRKAFFSGVYPDNCSVMKRVVCLEK